MNDIDKDINGLDLFEELYIAILEHICNNDLVYNNKYLFINLYILYHSLEHGEKDYLA